MQLKVGELLIAEGLTTEAELERALDEQRRTGSPLGEILVSSGTITRDQLFTVLAKQRDVAYWSLDTQPPSEEALKLLDSDLCARLHALPLDIVEGKLLLGMRNPDDLATIDAVQALTRLWVQPCLVDPSRLVAFLDLTELEPDADPFSMDVFVQRALDEGSIARSKHSETLHATTESDTRPVIGIVNHLIAEAVDRQASDIHLEPRIDRMEVRFRIDGQLVPVRDLPNEIAPMVVARIKILAELDVSENRMPQDGRIRVSARSRSIDLRVSVVPSSLGQRVVLRVLDKAVALKGLQELGYSETNLRIFRELIERPYGMVLVTGPTGSGKTTTLYAAVNELRRSTSNIVTVEDPVEYELPGVNQFQVLERIGLDFPTQLRAILRQDPDVILVGEVRDTETCETAIRAALTGHLVFSTLHCNDAAAAIPRLLDMGVDSYLLSTSVSGIVAQRLVRVLCRQCKEVSPVTEAEDLMLETLGFHGVHELHRARGCQNCYGTGYRGRLAVQEVLAVNDEVGALIASQSSMDAIRRAAASEGYEPMQMDALRRVLAGQTTLEEARRVVFFRASKNSMLLAGRALAEAA